MEKPIELFSKELIKVNLNRFFILSFPFIRKKGFVDKGKQIGVDHTGDVRHVEGSVVGGGWGVVE